MSCSASVRFCCKEATSHRARRDDSKQQRVRLITRAAPCLHKKFVRSCGGFYNRGLKIVAMSRRSAAAPPVLATELAHGYSHDMCYFQFFGKILTDAYMLMFTARARRASRRAAGSCSSQSAVSMSSTSAATAAVTPRLQLATASDAIVTRRRHHRRLQAACASCL